MEKHEKLVVVLICTLSIRQGDDGEPPLSQVFAQSLPTSIPGLASRNSR